MPACAICGEEHEFLEPFFRRPDAYVRLDGASREEHARANDDVCYIGIPGEATRYFLRGVLSISVASWTNDLRWGLWAEVSEASFKRVVDLWSEPNQASEPPFDGRLANEIPSYPSTLGLPLRVYLTGPDSRPRFRFSGDSRHPFVQESETGVSAHRASEWNKLLDEAQ